MASGEKQVGRHVLQKSMSQERRHKLMDAYSSGSEEENAPLNDRFLRERKHLLAVFPEEVWHVIFKHVEDPKDLESLSNSSLYLRELLLSQRVNFLLPTVLQTIGRNCNADVDAISLLVESDVCLLKLRSVCQYWKKTIDNLVENHPLHFYLQGDTKRQQALKLRNLIENTFSLDRRIHGHSLEIFHNKFDGTHGNSDKNPFLGRNIKLMFGEEEEVGAEFFEDFIEAVRITLEKYGQHLWYCSVYVVSLVHCETPFYPVIREFLELMPNLKVFTFLNKPIGYHLMDADKLEELRHQVSSSPLPTLPNLQMLATANLPASIFEELIRSNGHVVSLDVYKRHVMEVYSIETAPLPHLTTFSLDYCVESDIHRFIDSRVNWPLTKLFLNVLSFGKYGTWRGLFSIIERKFANTLTHLHLELPLGEDAEDEVSDEVADLHLNLPTLQNLSLVMSNVTCLDFMLPMKNSLKVFDLNINLEKTSQKCALALMNLVERGNGKIIKLLRCDYEKGAAESNMWELFPNLTQVDFKLKTAKNSDSYETLEWTLTAPGKLACRRSTGKVSPFIDCDMKAIFKTMFKRNELK